LKPGQLRIQPAPPAEQQDREQRDEQTDNNIGRAHKSDPSSRVLHQQGVGQPITR